MSKKKKKKSHAKTSAPKAETKAEELAKSSETTDSSESCEAVVDIDSAPCEAEIKEETAENADDTAKVEIPPEIEENLIPVCISETEIPYDPDFSSADFRKSIKKLRPKDIVMSDETIKKVKRKKKASAVSNIIQIFLLTICIGVAAVCLYMLGENIWGKIKGQQLYSNTEFNVFTLDDIQSPTSTGTLSHIVRDVPLLTVFERIETGKSAEIEPVPEVYNEQLAQMKASLSALKEQNSDVYGWIYVEGTNINHPVVRCDDNSYYLNHAYTGEYLPIGSIFADLTTKDLVTDNFNTVFYGHNVVSTGQSSMFHDVEKFLDKEFFENTNIYVYTMDGAFVFKPVAIYDTYSDYFYFKTVFQTEEEFLSFATEMVENSRFNSQETFVSGDRMLTLSTCTNGAQNSRYSLHAKLVEVIK